MRKIYAAAIALAVLAGGALPVSGPAGADQFLPGRGDWSTYINDRFHMRFAYPADVFRPAVPEDETPDDDSGRTFVSGDATLRIFAFPQSPGDTPRSLKRELVGSKGYEQVTYSPHGKTWLVLSGYHGDQIFYEKYFFKDGLISALGMSFPTARKPFYSPIIEKIEDSFRPGRLE